MAMDSDSVPKYFESLEISIVGICMMQEILEVVDGMPQDDII